MNTLSSNPPSPAAPPTLARAAIDILLPVHDDQREPAEIEDEEVEDEAWFFDTELLYRAQQRTSSPASSRAGIAA